MIEVAVTDDVNACLAIRREVFIEEQNVAEEIEMDGLEDDAIHILAQRDGVPIGCARILLNGSVGKIGRVAVLRGSRGLGLGKLIMEECRRVLNDTPGVTEARLGAQVYAIPFYEALGYVVTGPEFLDADIPHRPMALRL